MDQKHFQLFVRTPPFFSFRKTTQKYKFSEFFLLPIDPLMAIFNETRAATFRKYIYEQGIVMPN